ncbi:MAG: hypothetical protein J5952_02030 [Prevotella sp.]|nr:hypothetical protein [Prevotella sp.]
MKTKNVRTTWAALLTAALLSAPAVAWGQTQGVRVASTDVTKVNETENPASGQLVDATANSAVEVTVTDKTAENKVAKVTVRKVTDVKMTSFDINGNESVTYGSTTTYSITNIAPTYADLTGVAWSVTYGTGKANINSGVLTPTQAGTVTVTATSTANNTVKASKTVTINKAADPATLSPSSVDFGTTTDNKTVTVSGNTGTVSASVTSGSGCTVNVSGNTITITRNSNEAFNATVTVTIAASTNYNTTTKTINVKGSAVYQAGDAVLVTMDNRQFAKLYTSATNGYYIELNDKYTGWPENTGVDWNTACNSSESVGGNTFKCGTYDDWEKIMSACGGAGAKGYRWINDKCSSVAGWVNMTSSYYWTSSNGEHNPRCFSWDDGAESQPTSEYGVRLIAPF